MKKKQPKIILAYDTREGSTWVKVYFCPTCLHVVKNEDQTCKYCKEELKKYLLKGDKK